MALIILFVLFNIFNYTDNFHFYKEAYRENALFYDVGLSNDHEPCKLTQLHLYALDLLTGIKLKDPELVSLALNRIEDLIEDDLYLQAEFERRYLRYIWDVQD